MKKIYIFKKYYFKPQLFSRNGSSGLLLNF